MASRAVAVSASSRAAAADSSSAMSSKKTTKTYTYKTDGSGNVSTEVHTHVDSSSDQSSASMRRLEERIRVIQEDLDSEQQLRRRIDREKQALQMQIVALSERLTEAEGGAEGQLDVNRRREAEMAKLRRLLEEVHTESEQTIYALKRNHQEAMVEMQGQIEAAARAREKIAKEKSRFQAEIAELIARIEVLSQEKVSVRKVCERLEIHVNEVNVKMEDMSRQVAELTSQKLRLGQENSDSERRLNEMRQAIESAGLDKNKVASQLKEMQAHMDAVTRAKTTAESSVRSLQQQVKSLVVEIEEHRSYRVEIDRQVSKLREEGGEWKKRFEHEAHLRVEDVDTLKKKYLVQLNEMQDQFDAAVSKLKTMEKEKGRLQQEIALMVREIEQSQMVARDLTGRCKQSESRCEELAAKLREMTNLYERADKENKNRGQELVRMANEMDRCKMENETLKRDTGKLQDDCRSYKQELDAVKARLHTAEQENRKLAHDRQELARAYKESEAGRAKAEQRVVELEDELKRLRADAERTLHAKEEEAAGGKRKLVAEIESLSSRLHETESKLRNEVEKMKKKMSVTIAELEMSLDAANRSNAQLSGTSKAQAQRIAELSSFLEAANQKIQSVTEHYESTVKRLQVTESELVNVRRVAEQAVSAGKGSEAKLFELTNCLNETSRANEQLVVSRTKLEKELERAASGYEEVGRELKLADERANRAAADAQHFEGLLREEHARLVNVDGARKALENEVRSMTVRMEEIETSSVATSQRTIQKMEVRIEELEFCLQKEKKCHLETAGAMHKKDRSVKELLLQSAEDRKSILILQESLDRLNEKIKMYRRQLEEQEAMSNSNIMRVKKFQRELEAAEGRAEEAESCLDSFRSQQRVFAAASVDNRRETAEDNVDRTVVIRKTVTNVNSNNAANTVTTSSNNRAEYTSGRAARTGGSSSYARAGSMARTSMARGGSVGRAGSTARY